MRKFKHTTNHTHHIIALALLLLMTTVIITNTTSIVKADTSELINLETTDEVTLNHTIEKLVTAILTQDSQYIISNETIFTTNVYNKINNFIFNEKNRVSYTGILDMSIERITPEDSSTKDCVIMANIKIGMNETANEIYLFEFHVNADGKIYGYNIWAY